MAELSFLQESNENLASFGQYGHRILSAAETSVAGEYFFAIIALQDAVVDYTSSPNQGGGDTTITNLTLNKGCSIYGRLTTITVDSGECVAYLMSY